jgi:excinuclease ABC subunit A
LSPRARPRTVAASSRSRFAPFLRAALDPDAPSAVTRGAGDRPRSAITVPDAIILDGAREHTLQVPHLEIPAREASSPITGPSGSGKSSLAFDVIYAEGQRRFLETLSPYARQYLPSLGRADVDRIVGIPPAISLEQRTARAGAMSTVATVTEVAHYLRLLYARAATPFCPKCDVPIGARSPESIAEELRGAHARRNANLSVWAPVVQGAKGPPRRGLRPRPQGWR